MVEAGRAEEGVRAQLNPEAAELDQLDEVRVGIVASQQQPDARGVGVRAIAPYQRGHTAVADGHVVRVDGPPCLLAGPGQRVMVGEAARVEAGVEAVKAAPKPKAKRVRKPAVKKTVAVVVDEPAEAVQKAPVMEPVSEPVVEAAPVVEVAAVVKPSPEPEPETPAASKKRGWWSRG